MLLAALLCTAEPIGVAAAPESDAGITFEIARRRGLDTSGPLEWTFQVGGVAGATNLRELIARLKAAEFTDLVVPEEDAENDAGTYSVWFSDVRAHSVDSLAERLEFVESLAARYGGTLEYHSVGAIEDP